MSEMLSQAEIDALLKGSSDMDDQNNQNIEFTSQEIDALGEVGNISMGSSATTLSSLINQRVIITTPTVSVTTWDEISMEYNHPYVAVNVEYTVGLSGNNLMILKESDVKLITDLMMGGDGQNIDVELNDFHLSAISEAMNQMIGSASTSMSSIFKTRVEISPPVASIIKSDMDRPYNLFESSSKFVKVAFKMIIGDLADSKLIQVMPIEFAKKLVDNLLNSNSKNEEVIQNTVLERSTQNIENIRDIGQSQDDYRDQMSNNSNNQINVRPAFPEEHKNREPVNVQPASFQPFKDEVIELEKNNINLIMDVPLQITVELGRTHKLIKDILEFGQGSIIELDKLAGDPVNILVNGKPIAKGEVVVIDESFAVRITDIIHPSKRL